MTARADFPYCDGHPVPITGRGWVLLMLSVAVAFTALITIPAETFPATLVPASLFAAIPLLALAHLTKRHWTALFGPVGLKQVGQMFLFGILAIIASLAAGVTVYLLGSVASNPVVAGMGAMSGTAFVLRLIPTLPQLLGEELLSILPFLALLWLATSHLGLSRTAGIAVALLGSSFLFAAAHLPTYDWHWAQCLGVIGTARVILTLSYIWTRNLWVSTGAHIINDWSEFTFAFAASHVPIGTR
ncbi:CAAX amino protease [Skermanella stibiiresistens SB22]|uniref:CAAX amino protease n=1 Tax=Skermanella stibiiresistens SB22 TaxID=1385369 RepID=W9H5Q2_9PROT|nr:CPBP family intramembrane glutamic endopeptidase [Skermanella stibiiresistens]EWY41565.1 CAAX amino protease [Skermanella stibiiresistens SB22]